jgi:adenylate cyclase
MLLNLNKAGGVLNLTLDSGDERIFVSGRRLKEMNWIALAIHRQPKEKWTTINTRTTLALATAVYLLILIFYLSQWLQGFFLKPVLALEENARRITAGNYDLQSVINTEDEMGYLAKSFAKMAQDLKEKEFLGRFLSDIAKDAIAGKQTTKATRIEATILFSDIRSFTTLSETYAPEEIGLMLNSYMTVMEEVIEEHGGSIEKFIGDAIMALFLPRLGLPHPVVRATKAAHQMMKKLDEYNAQRKKEKRFTIKNGAGIASGELIMGTMGNLKGRKDYTVTGPTVNLAAEMEKWSKQTKHLPIVLCAKSRQIVQEYGINCNKLELENQLEAYEPGFANN